MADLTQSKNRIAGDRGFKNKTLLITGGTGFLGKVFIEKILRTGLLVKTIYVIVRSRKENDPQTRIKKMFENPVFVHVSTAYCFPQEQILYEKVYSIPINPDDVIRLVETRDNDTIETAGKKYMGKYPNTYVLSKALAEMLVCDAMDDLPLIIARPSVGKFLQAQTENRTNSETDRKCLPAITLNVH
ncbi:hypothetical protein ILUMI_08675 [Ignelater luminosus]|uniref:Fatty acyl-CoA reductase n=1 Tax=Ignelater luminosus TaxID=2038154 RepID=A0A8K0D3X9_IGNLU|nr:hypothetical protein ILUMI_08675 [Ignelater luminosus]